MCGGKELQKIFPDRALPSLGSAQALARGVGTTYFMLWARLWVRARWPVMAVQACPAVMEEKKGHDWKRFLKNEKEESHQYGVGTGDRRANASLQPWMPCKASLIPAQASHP